MTMPIPRYLLNSYSEITPEWLRQRGLEAVAADLDDTLSRYSDKSPPPEAAAWIKTLKEANIPVGIVSNNRSLKRVRTHASALGIPCVCPARKPRPDGLLKLAAMLGAEPSRMAVVGDQIFTDAGAAARAGMVSVRVPPLSRNVLVIIRKFIEWPFLLAAKIKEERSLRR